MPYKDPERRKEKQRERSRRHRKKARIEKYGYDAPDQRGKHKHHARGSNHPRWSNARIISSHGYVKIRAGRTHPLADPNGYAYEHIMIWVSAGLPRPSGEQILHHVNDDILDNRIENLKLMTSSSHKTFHNSVRERDELGRFLSKMPEPAL